MPKWGGRLYATDRARDFDHEHDRNTRTRQIYETIDRQSYQWVVVIVAGIGFFLDGYTLFASNIVLPMVAYVYWHDELSSRRESFINIATLAGTLVGQIFFGIVADKIGRKKTYGAELVLIIGATLGVTMCSTGADNSMNIFAWLIWWRIVVGIGVGADYPLSAVITSEFAPTRHRARMMASVFFMQPLGQICGNLVSLLVILGVRNQHQDDNRRAVDSVWRWVIGVGVLPGVIALFFRVAIPETPRFMLEVEDDPIKAEFDAAYLFGETFEDETEMERQDTSTSSYVGRHATTHSSSSSPTIHARDMSDPAPLHSAHAPTLNSNWRLTRADMHRYFICDGNWKTLAATSLSWLLLDFCFYGIGLSNPQFLAKTWGGNALHLEGHPSPIWRTTDDPSVSIFTMLNDTSVRALVILNIGTLVGGALLIFFIKHVNRVRLQTYGFLFLAALFIALGTVLYVRHETGVVVIVLYIIGQIVFNFGPNSTTYMIPAEVFPTRYRASCHGISAAAGKLGSILVQLFSMYYGLGASSPNEAQTRRYGKVLIVFSAVMVAGAFITWMWIPDVQEKDNSSKTLEVLAIGRAGKSESRLGLRRRGRRLLGR